MYACHDASQPHADNPIDEDQRKPQRLRHFLSHRASRKSKRVDLDIPTKSECLNWYLNSINIWIDRTIARVIYVFYIGDLNHIGTG